MTKIAKAMRKRRIFIGKLHIACTHLVAKLEHMPEWGQGDGELEARAEHWWVLKALNDMGVMEKDASWNQGKRKHPVVSKA